MGFRTTDINSFLDSIITGTLYVALWTTAPDNDGSGGVEVSGGGYARVAHSAWNAAANKTKTNNGEIDFGDPTADWGTVVAVTLMTALSGGSQVAVSNPISQAVVAADDKVYIPDAGASFGTS